jgi:hypothetical protein
MSLQEKYSDLLQTNNSVINEEFGFWWNLGVELKIVDQEHRLTEMYNGLNEEDLRYCLSQMKKIEQQAKTAGDKKKAALREKYRPLLEWKNRLEADIEEKMIKIRELEKEIDLSLVNEEEDYSLEKHKKVDPIQQYLMNNVHKMSFNELENALESVEVLFSESEKHNLYREIDYVTFVECSFALLARLIRMKDKATYIIRGIKIVKPYESGYMDEYKRFRSMYQKLQEKAKQKREAAMVFYEFMSQGHLTEDDIISAIDSRRKCQKILPEIATRKSKITSFHSFPKVA